MDTVNKKHKYKILLSILLGQYILVEVLSAIEVNLENEIVNIISVIVFAIPVILLLNTVSKDTKFTPQVRSLAEIAMWVVGVCAVGGFLAEYVFPFPN